jgi:hypothetical protein
VDLTRSEYRGHIGLSAPSRSGTTHLTVETILQIKGWESGWSLVKGIAANAKVITQKSSHVPKGVVGGEFGIGIVIDFYGLVAKAQGESVDFTYPTNTVLVPASIAVLKKSKNSETAKQFIDFLLSPQGQKLLLSPQISRLPIRPETYSEDEVPEYFPRPYSAKELGSHIAFDVLKSKGRYNVVNSLFDQMITYRFDDLRLTMQAIQDAEKLVVSKALPGIAKATTQARGLVYLSPIDELSSRDPKFSAIFTKKSKTSADIIGGKQGEIERVWDMLAEKNYKQARKIINTLSLAP